MAVITFRPHAFSPRARCYALGRYRVHHGATGALLIAIGAVLCAHDRRDFPWCRDA